MSQRQGDRRRQSDVTRFPQRGAGVLRELFSGRAPAWPDLTLAESEELLAALEYHGAAPLAHEAVCRGGASGVPPEVIDRLHRAHLSTAAENQVWLAERGAVLDALHGAGVTAALLKGAALMDTVYSSPGLRPISDIDLLVSPAQQATTLAALKERGYERAVTDAGPFEHHVLLHGTGAGGMPVAVEVHRRLFASPPYDAVLPTDDLLARAERGEDGALRLAPADALAHLAGHLVLQHARGERLVWVADVDRLVRRHGHEQDFWSGAIEVARSSMLLRSLGDALVLATLWFATPLPDDVAAVLDAEPPMPAEAAAYARMRRRAPVGAEGDRLLSDVQGVSGLAAKLRFAALHLAPPPRTMREWYGLDRSWQLPVYYARRALRGLAHIARRPFRAGSSGALESPELWMIDHDA
ncbi:MAG: nucleotidyltransferase family protein [Anaerolineae bacterium]